MKSVKRLMKRSGILITFIFILMNFVITPGCQNPSNDSQHSNLSATQISCDNPDKVIDGGPWLDPSMHPNDCAGIQTIYHGFKTAAVSAVPGSFFDLIFKGTGSDAVMRYLNARVLYIVPASANFRISSGNKFVDIPKAESDLIIALNISTAMWLTKKDTIHRVPDLRFWLGRTPIEVSSPSDGFIQLGEKFAQYHLIMRMETMVHEARHSDCDSGTDDECGFTHVNCPPEHDYKDQPACDNRGIGAYFIGATYAKALAESCGNCSEEEKQVARLVAADSIGRVLNISEIKEQNVVNGSRWSQSKETLSRVHAGRKAELGK